MLPNVRLMIAATLASVVALICGFGMFAVFRVSHEPFVRVPAATAPLRLVADNAARSSADFASGAPLAHRLELRAQPSAAEVAHAPGAADEHDTAAAATPATAPAADAAAPQATSAMVGEPTGQPSASVSPSSEAPAATTDSAPPGDARDVAAASAPNAAPSTATADVNTAAPLPDPTIAGPDQAITSTVASLPGPEPAPSGALEAAASEPQNEPPPASEPASLVTAPADAADPADEGPHKIEAKKPKHGHVVRIRRAPQLAETQYSETQMAPAQYAPAGAQSFGTTQINFQTAAAAQTRYFVVRPARVRHARTAAKKSKEPDKPNKEPNTATGGPLVSATGR
jgi:hypothetical protein